jgi:hypothetical protein
LILLGKIFQIQTAFFIQQFALLIKAAALAVPDPLGNCSIVGPLFFRNREVLLDKRKITKKARAKIVLL